MVGGFVTEYIMLVTMTSLGLEKEELMASVLRALLCRDFMFVYFVASLSVWILDLGIVVAVVVVIVVGRRSSSSVVGRRRSSVVVVVAPRAPSRRPPPEHGARVCGARRRCVT